MDLGISSSPLTAARLWSRVSLRAGLTGEGGASLTMGKRGLASRRVREEEEEEGTNPCGRAEPPPLLDLQ